MWTVRGLAAYPPDGPGAVVALGTFDGVHLGHRAILGMAVDRARELGLTAVACTFDPPPSEVLRPDRAPRPIATLEERLGLMAASGLDGTVVVPFTRDTAMVEAETFVTEVLLETVRAREIVVGFNHTFGRGARGNAELLRKLGERLGFRAHVVPPFRVDGVAVSSTGIREALAEGAVERAARFLGRPYTISGEVVRGAGRGRGLGFPTANIRPDRLVLVKAGVYAGVITVGAVGYRAVVNVGVRPTFDERDLAVEAHVLGFSGDLYARPVRLGFVRRLRDEQRFPSVEALREQIARDVAEAARGRF